MHLDPGHDALARVRQADDGDLLARLDLPAFHPSGRHGAASGDGEDVFNGHQERLVGVTLGGGDVGIDGVQEFPDVVDPLVLTTGGLGVLLENFQRLQSAALDHGQIVAGELVLAQEFADFHLDELEQFFVVDHVDLVHEDDDVGHADLTGEQDVLAGLGHRAVGGGDDQDRAVHLRSTGDHVLHIVSVAGAVDVSIVTVLRLVLDVGGIDGDAAGLLFRGRVDLIVRLEGRAAGLSQDLGDRCGQRGLAMVNVTDGADVAVRLVPLKFSLRHCCLFLR